MHYDIAIVEMTYLHDHVDILHDLINVLMWIITNILSGSFYRKSKENVPLINVNVFPSTISFFWLTPPRPRINGSLVAPGSLEVHGIRVKRTK